MNLSALLNETWERLGSNFDFYLASELVTYLNWAQLLLGLFKPSLLSHRVALTQPVRALTADLRAAAPRAMRVLRVMLGDVTGDDPILSQSLNADSLRRSNFKSLQLRRDWFLRLAVLPTHWFFWYPYVGTWPRCVVANTITVVYQARPTALNEGNPNASPDIPEVWHPVLVELASAFGYAKQGSGAEIEKALEIFQRVLGREPFGQLEKRLRRLRMREQFQPSSSLAQGAG